MSASSNSLRDFAARLLAYEGVLVERIEPEGLEVLAPAPVAEALVPHRPEWVIRASTKQAEDLIVQTKSNLYPAAADWLKRAKAAYAKLGRTSEWQKYLRELKEQYKRRPALQAQLAKL
jgi:uncharacterized Zn finger protein